MANNKFGAKEVMDVILYDMETNKPVIYFDTLKTSEIAVTSEKVYARGGKGNSKLLTWEINKEALLTIEDALLSPKSIELVTGIARKEGKQVITMRQATVWDADGDKGGNFPLTADASGVIELAFVPKEAAANILVYPAADDCGEPISMTDAELSGKEITVPSAANQKVVVYYTCDSSENAESYTVDATKFSGTYKLVGNTIVRNQATGKDESFQITMPNLKWSSNLTLGFSAEGDPSATSFECEIMKAADNNTMIQMVKW